MPPSQGFGSCLKPMAKGYPHDSSLKCLGESHQSNRFKICRGFTSRTKKEWDSRLKVLLMESALRPEVVLDPAQRTSVQSTPASVRDVLVLRKDSSKEPRHRHFPTPGTSSSV